MKVGAKVVGGIVENSNLARAVGSALLRRLAWLPIALGVSACSLSEADLGAHRPPTTPDITSDAGQPGIENDARSDGATIEFDAGGGNDSALANDALGSDAPGNDGARSGLDDSQLVIRTVSDADALRQKLIHAIWGTQGFPTKTMPSVVEKNVPSPLYSPLTNLARIDRLVIDMGNGVKNETFHFIPKVDNGRLVIVHQGHHAELEPGEIGATIAALVAEGFGVLGAGMPCLNAAFPCPVQADAGGGNPHNALFEDIELPPGGGMALKYFLEHIATSLNYLKTMSSVDGFPAYSEFDMTGLSGGGWSTVLYAALDRTIKISIPVSGTKPLYLRDCPGPNCENPADGDREQSYFPFYSIAGYLDLYALGAEGSGRRQIQVQIRYDGCCFGEYQFGGYKGLTWEQVIRTDESKLQSLLKCDGDRDVGWYRYEVDETSVGDHMISPYARTHIILAELTEDHHRCAQPDPNRPTSGDKPPSPRP